MIQFLKESKRFNGITFSGHFSININDLEVLHDHYQQTGENLIDDYCTVIYLSWDLDDRMQLMDNEILNENLKAISRIRKLGLFRPTLIHSIQNYCRRCYQRLQDQNERSLSKERRKACSYTSKKSIREWVFTTHGEVCLSCGSTENITIDHIKPIAKGGENKLSNLQPLCKSCNSSKGIKIEDYRDGKQ